MTKINDHNPIPFPTVQPVDAPREFKVGDRVVYKRPSWDPKAAWGDRHGQIVDMVMEAQSTNVQSMKAEPLFAVQWDGIHKSIERGYRARYLRHEKE